MSTKTIERTLKDADGVEHEYKIMQHGADSGFGLMLDVIEAAGKPLGHLISAVKEVTEEERLSLKDIDGEALGTALTGLAIEVRRKGGISLVKRLLANTFRDGKKFAPEGLSGEKHWAINDTYQGNYGEMLEAIGVVVEVNFLRFLSGPQAALGRLLKSQARSAS